MFNQEWELLYYVSENGRFPFQDWLDSLNDLKAKAIALGRLARLRGGNFGHSQPVGLGVFEQKIDYGPGYRLYYGRIGTRVILLLCGGDKSTQQKDIQTAHRYWQRFKEK